MLLSAYVSPRLSVCMCVRETGEGVEGGGGREGV